MAKGILKEKFTFHDIRAMAVTDMNNTHGLKAAQELAGHSTDRMTKRVYVRGITKWKPLK